MNTKYGRPNRCLSSATDFGGVTTVQENDSVAQSAAAELKNSYEIIQGQLDDGSGNAVLLLARSGVCTVDPTLEYLSYTDDLWPIGSMLRRFTITAGVITACEWYVKNAANNGASTSGFKLVTHA